MFGAVWSVAGLAIFVLYGAVYYAVFYCDVLLDVGEGAFVVFDLFVMAAETKLHGLVFEKGWNISGMRVVAGYAGFSLADNGVFRFCVIGQVCDFVVTHSAQLGASGLQECFVVAAMWGVA